MTGVLRSILTAALVLGLLLSAISCTQTSSVTPTPAPTPTITPILQGETIVITSSADSGPGTLRQALLDAQSGETITFDPAVFPPSAPATIYLSSGLPPVTQGNLTIDASNAGVILDGSKIGGEFVSGLAVGSNENTIRGLQVSNSSGAGIALSGGARHNLIEGNLVVSNNIGIGLWDNGTSYNTITGNLIGTDGEGTNIIGNGVGIFIMEGASYNTIGPSNLIAYNRQSGIQVSESAGNTLTQNSIHDNEGAGIFLVGSGNSQLSAPFIFDFDLASGTVTGAACPNSHIEIFSDSGNQGQVYEGQTVSSSEGAFAFSKGAPFTGPHLTATATDADDNSSEFSPPTSGQSRFVVIQEGNNLPKSQLQPKRPNQLEDNRIGAIWGLSNPEIENVDLDGILDEITAIGLKRVKLVINQRDVETKTDSPRFVINPKIDDWISDIVSNGVTITLVLGCWLDYRDETDPCGGHLPPKFQTEQEIQSYLDYVRFIVGHFKDRIIYYEIWNEPEIKCPGIEAADYIALTKRAIPVIRQEYPEAKIVVGSVVLQDPLGRDFLFEILRSDVLPLVDVVSLHPMFGPSPEFEPQYYYDYPSLVQQIKDTASAHGFRGEYRGDELQWTSPDCPTCNPEPSYSRVKAAKYSARGIVMHLGMDLAVTYAGGTVSSPALAVLQNLCTLLAGARPISLTMEIQSEATNIRSYSFSLPNGDKLLALWTDVVAVDDDPGIEATITLPDFSAKKVTGIDVLNSFDQELVTSIEDGSLVIHDLLIKDYPVIIRLSD